LILFAVAITVVKLLINITNNKKILNMEQKWQYNENNLERKKSVRAKMLKYSTFELGAAALEGINNAVLFPWGVL